MFYQHSTSFATLHVNRDINKIIRPAVIRKITINITCLFRRIPNVYFKHKYLWIRTNEYFGCTTFSHEEIVTI